MNEREDIKTVVRYVGRDRWAAHGLKWNPFRVLEPDELVHVLVPMETRIGMTIDALWARSEPLVEVLGAQGLGKTTSLRAVEAFLRDRDIPVVYHYLPPERGDSIPRPAGSVLLLDEIQRLTIGERRWLAKWLRSGQGRAICGTHRYWHPRGVAMHRIDLGRVDARIILDFFQRRVTYAGGAHRYQLSGEAARWIADRIGTLRGAEQLLYEVFQHISEQADNTLAQARSRLLSPLMIGCEQLRAAAPNLRRYKVQVARRRWLRPTGLFSTQDRSRL